MGASLMVPSPEQGHNPMQLGATLELWAEWLTWKIVSSFTNASPI